MKAARIIMRAYFRYRTRKYLENLKSIAEETRSLYTTKALVVVPTPEQKKRFERWPKPDERLIPIMKKFKQLYFRWKAWMLLGKIPKEQWTEFRLKVIATCLLGGRRPNFGLQDSWHGDYLASTGFNPRDAMAYQSHARTKLPNQRIIFSSKMFKASSSLFGKKTATQLILVIESEIVTMDANKFTIEKRLNISDLIGLSITKDVDQCMAIKSRANKNDLVIVLVDSREPPQCISRIGELVAVISRQFHK